MSIKIFFASSFIILMVFFAILAFSLYTGVIRISISDAEEYHKDSLNKMASVLEIQLDNLNRFAGSLCYDMNYNSTNQGPEDLWEYREILKNLQVYSALNELDARFTLFLGSKNKGLSSHENVISMSPDLMNPLYSRNRHWMIDYSDMGDRLSYFIVHDGEYPERQVSVLISIGRDALHKQLEALNIRNKGIAFILDKEGRTIFSRDTSYKYLISQEDIKINQEGLLLLKNKKLRIMYTPLTEGLSLGLVFPDDSIMMPVKKNNRLLVILFTLAMILFTSIFLLLYRWITNPLQNLYTGMSSVESGNFEVVIQGHHINELDYILNKFNSMAARINLLMNEVRLESLRSQEAELRFLQAQINPHFLYNNLYFIYQVSIAGENEKAAEMAISLSKYFKSVTKPKDSLVPLKLELENLHNYIKLFSLRHPDRFRYEENIDEQLMHLPVPRLLLQPIVENSIVYGLDNSSDSMIVSITAKKVEKNVVITIADSGTGMDTAKMDELNMKLSNNPELLEGCGLKNPLQRLLFRYGSSSSIRLEVNDMQGITVSVTFPEKLENQKDILL